MDSADRRFLLNFINEVECFINEHDLIKPKQKVVVAVSGGIDSMVLLDVLNTLSGKMNFSIHVAHLDHGIRQSSDKDAKFVMRKCEEMGIPYTVDRRVVRKEKGKSMEELARDVRYEFLREVKEKIGGHVIATAHHLSDLVETVIYRLIRGTGPIRAAGIIPRNGDIIRPLIFISKADIERYAKLRKIPYIVDETNYDLTIRRNFIRHRIVPLLKMLNPSVESAFYRYSLVSWMLKRFVDRHVNEFLLMNAKKFHHGWEVKIPNDDFLLTEVVRVMYEDLYGRTPELEKVLKVVKRKNERSFKVEFYKDSGVWKYKDRIFVGLLKTNGFEYELKEGIYDIGDFKILISKECTSGTVGLRWTKGMKIRNRNKGDRVGKRKLKDLLIEKDVPVYFRDVIPMIAVESRVVYVPELWVDKGFLGEDFYIKILRSPFERR